MVGSRPMKGILHKWESDRHDDIYDVGAMDVLRRRLGMALIGCMAQIMFAGIVVLACLTKILISTHTLTKTHTHIGFGL